MVSFRLAGNTSKKHTNYKYTSNPNLNHMSSQFIVNLKPTRNQYKENPKPIKGQYKINQKPI